MNDVLGPHWYFRLLTSFPFLLVMFLSLCIEVHRSVLLYSVVHGLYVLMLHVIG